jgi:hypothetical protein
VIDRLWGLLWVDCFKKMGIPEQYRHLCHPRLAT